MRTPVMKSLLTSAFVVFTVAVTGAQSPARPSRTGSDPQFKVRLDFNRWHDTDEIKSDLLRLEKAWPKFLKYSSLGKSHGGRDMMLMTINNPDSGAEMTKPAMYIEANVHGNEIQGSEVSLYTIWYLMGTMIAFRRSKSRRRARVYIVPPVIPRPRSRPQRHGSLGTSTCRLTMHDGSMMTCRRSQRKAPRRCPVGLAKATCG